MLCLEGLIIWLGLGVVPNLALLFWVLVLAEPVGEDGVDEVRERLWSRGGSGSVLVGPVKVEVIWGLVPDQLLSLVDSASFRHSPPSAQSGSSRPAAGSSSWPCSFLSSCFFPRDIAEPSIHIFSY